MSNKAEKKEILEANIYVHSFLAKSGEYNKSPHFLPENKQKIREFLAQILPQKNSNFKSKAIDFGCGTGFMIDLIRDLFDEIHGVDITEEMMNQVDLSSGNVFLHKSVAENVPFSNDFFNFAAAYSFMDHLLDYKDFLREVYRVLVPGGIFFSGLNPNRNFSLAIAEANNFSPLNAIVDREVIGVLNNGNYYEKNYGINPDLLEKAEPIKTLNKGFSATEVIEIAKNIGFSSCRVDYEWFLGQGKFMREYSSSEILFLERYLNECLPVSSSLFKYLRFVFVK
jgi:ubiquinone/menaquinone biosynthesis C-methylase UbiE